MPKDPKESVITESPIASRADLDNLFLNDDEDLGHLYTAQQSLPIETFAEARENGSFVPKPRAWDVHKSLRTFRRCVLKANEVGALKFSDIKLMIESMVECIDLSEKQLLRDELKKYLYVVMRDKKYAEMLDGDTQTLLKKSLEETLNNLPLRLDFFWNADLEEVKQAWCEIMQEIDPPDETGLPLNDPVRRAEIKKRFPTLYKIEYESN